MPDWLSNAYADMNVGIAEQHRYYGATFQYEHLAKSHTTISATAQAALRRAPAGESRTAILLGAGGCFDIPLEEIVTEFDTTTIIDADTAQTEKALSTLPPRLLGKISLQQHDITGSIAAFGKSIGEASKADYRTFVAQTTAQARKLAEAEPASGITGEYNFTCSQLVMSQLGSIPVLRLARYAEERYGKPLTLRPGGEDEPLVYALNDLTMANHINHAKLLGQLTKPTGTAHFADTVIEVQNNAKLPMISQEPLKVLEESFDDLTEDAVWTWTPDLTRTFWVMAKSLGYKARA